MGIMAWLTTRWKNNLIMCFIGRNQTPACPPLLFLLLPWQSCWVSGPWMGVLRTDCPACRSLMTHLISQFLSTLMLRPPPSLAPSWEISPEDTRGPHLACTLFNGAAVNTLRLQMSCWMLAHSSQASDIWLDIWLRGEGNGNLSSLRSD